MPFHTKNGEKIVDFADMQNYFDYCDYREIIKSEIENCKPFDTSSQSSGDFFSTYLSLNGYFHKDLLEVLKTLCQEKTDPDAYKNAYKNILPPYGNSELRRLDPKALKEYLKDSSAAQDILESVLNVTCQGRCLLTCEQAYELLLFCALFAYVQRSPKRNDENALQEILKLKTPKNIAEELKEKLLSPDSLYEELIAAACQTDLDYYEKVIARWALDDGKKTLDECIRTIGDTNNGIFSPDVDFVSQACGKWLDKFNSALHKEISQTFLLTDKEIPRLTPPDLSTVFPTTKLDNPFRINIGMFFDSYNCPDDPYDTEQQFDRAERQEILRVFNSHRNGLANGFELDYGKNGYKVKIVNNPTADIRFEGNTAIVASISSIYGRPLSVEKHAAPILKAVQNALQEQLEALQKQLKALTDEQIKQLEILKKVHFQD